MIVPSPSDLLLLALQGTIDAWNAAVEAAGGPPGGAAPLPTPLPDPGFGLEGVNIAYDNLRDTFNTFLPRRASENMALARFLGYFDPLALGVGAGATGSIDPATIGVGAGATGSPPP